MSAKKKGYKVGQKFIYKSDGGSIDWFADGSTITLTDAMTDTTTPGFDGPAKEENIGGRRCKAGDIISGYAYLKDVTPFPADISPAVEFSVTVKAGRTTFDFAKALTPEQVTDVLAAAGL